jgi:hypothetical protein
MKSQGVYKSIIALAIFRLISNHLKMKKIRTKLAFLFTLTFIICNNSQAQETEKKLPRRTYRKTIPEVNIKAYSEDKEVQLLPIETEFINLKAIANSNSPFFKSDDMTYSVVKCKTTLARGGRAVETHRNGSKIDLTGFDKQTGDVIQIEIFKVQRIDGEGNIEEVTNYGSRFIAMTIGKKEI